MLITYAKNFIFFNLSAFFGINIDNLLLRTAVVLCYNLLFCAVLLCSTEMKRILLAWHSFCSFWWCESTCRLSLSRLTELFVNGDLLCYDGRMDEWEGAAGG